MTRFGMQAQVFQELAQLMPLCEVANKSVKDEWQPSENVSSICSSASKALNLTP
jgi:hypothetical protein